MKLSSLFEATERDLRRELLRLQQLFIDQGFEVFKYHGDSMLEVKTDLDTVFDLLATKYEVLINGQRSDVYKSADGVYIKTELSQGTIYWATVTLALEPHLLSK